MNNIVSRSNKFNKVQRIWKATTEYYPNPWRYYVDFINILKSRGARFITMGDALAKNYNKSDINILLDHHIDYYVIETEVMCRWELENDVISNVYLFNRFEYYDSSQLKIWDVEDLNIEFYQELERRGFEIGYHQNAVGLVRTSKVGRSYDKNISRDDMEKAKAVFARDVDNLSRYFKIRTFIPHGAGEANAHLLDLPKGYEWLTWVYNNAHRNKTITPPIKWNNYSDSCGQRTQRIMVPYAHYLLHMDNLHVKAYMAEPGLHHILIHSGRFGKGMPYHLYDGSTSSEEHTSVNLEFDTSIFNNDDDLPLSSASLVGRWECGQGKMQRVDHWNSRSDTYNIPEILSKYYLLSDDIEVLRNHMARNSLCIPFLHVCEEHDKKKKLAMQKSFHPNKSIVASVPVPPEGSSHDSQECINKLFREQFLAFYNTCYSKKILIHLIDAGLLYNYLHLTRLEITNKRTFNLLFQVLHHYLEADKVVLRINALGFNTKKWNKLLGTIDNAEEILAKYTVEVNEISSSECTLLIRSKEPGTFSSDGRKRTEQFKNVSSKKLSFKWLTSRFQPKLFNVLSAEDKKKLERLSKVRGESIVETFNKFSKKVDDMPLNFNKHTKNLLRFDFPKAGMRDGMPYVELPNRRVFYGCLPNKKTRREFEFLKDRISHALSANTYLTALDVTSRYLTNYSWYPKELLPGKGGTVVEAGAYLGHKTIRFIDDAVGTEGKVLAVEMMPDNIEILRRNVKENGLKACVDIVESGVWNEKCEIKVMGKGRQRNSLVPIDKIGEDAKLTVPVNSLDNILKSWGEKTIDFLVITVNGAEVEVLQGLEGELDRVKVIYVAACYTRNGQRTYESCLKILKDSGCLILPQSTEFVIYAVTKRFAEVFSKKGIIA